MPIQLTPNQEHRIQAIVNSGAYASTQEALDAAVAAVESVASTGFEGRQEELEALLLEGLRSGEPIEADEAFWNRVKRETDQMVAEQFRNSKPDPGDGRRMPVSLECCKP